MIHSVSVYTWVILRYLIDSGNATSPIRTGGDMTMSRGKVRSSKTTPAFLQHLARDNLFASTLCPHPGRHPSYILSGAFQHLPP